MKTRNFLLIAVSIWLAQNSVAARAGAPIDPCDGADTQLALNACWSSRASEADKIVNHLLTQVRRAARGPIRSDLQIRLDKAQAEWIRYRDLHCDLVTIPLEGASSAGMAHSICFYRAARQRAAALSDVLADWSPR
jgi:uncharacterized protein YecT (DUF1311 family)